LEYIYWVQGPACVPKGYESPDEIAWRKEEEVLKDAEKVLTEMKDEMRDAFKGRAVGLAEPARWRG
jgi:hypothetical protein